MKNEPCCQDGGIVTDVASKEVPHTLPAVREADTSLSLGDVLGGWRARWGINRMNYKVHPGLYRIGSPNESSPVLVTANYTLTFDAVRKELGGLGVWLLVLDTKGVNVWCAAGKGTFGTGELVRSIEQCSLAEFVNHRTLILPQLGAPGVAAHEVKKTTGFSVVYGPVYAKDIKAFLAGDMHATTEMRRVRFGVVERLKVIPVEIVYSWWLLPVALAAIVIFRLIDGSVISGKILSDFLPYAGAYVVGTTLFQIVLPWLPGRSFAFKGWLLGFAWAVTSNHIGGYPLWQCVSHMLIIPVIVSFWALNFTGATTFSSRSGVLKEMRIAVPLMIAGIVSGILVRIIPVVIN